jgi:sugar phosphate isomerase/epimerase
MSPNTHRNGLPLAASSTWLSRVPQITGQNVRRVILEDAADMLEDGFDAVELPIPLVGSLVESLSSGFWQEIGGALREMGLEPLSVHGPNLPTLDADVAATKHNLTHYARACTALGVKALVVHPTSHTHPHVCTVLPRLLERDIELALHISDELGDGPTKLALENLPTYSMRYLRELIGSLDRANIGVCFDTGHYNVRPEGAIDDVIKALSKRIVHLHLTDNHGLCDEHLAPGAGNFPFDELFRALPASWRTGPWLVELSGPIFTSDPDALAKTRAIHRAASELSRRTLGLAIRNSI